MGRNDDLLFFLIKKKSEVVSNEVLPDPFVCLCGNAQGVGALIDLHLLAAENEAGSSGSRFPDLWRYDCPQEPLDWDGDV